jgi:hypothetical protein
MPYEEHIKRGKEQNIDLEETVHHDKVFLRQSSVKDNHQRESSRHEQNYSKHLEKAKQLGYLYSIH